MNLMIIASDTTTIISSIVVFLLFTLLLVYIILLAKAKLMPSGLVKITINGQEEIKTEAGYSLLTTLSNNKIFLHPHVVEVEPVLCVNARYYQEAVKY